MLFGVSYQLLVCKGTPSPSGKHCQGKACGTGSGGVESGIVIVLIRSWGLSFGSKIKFFRLTGDVILVAYTTSDCKYHN